VRKGRAREERGGGGSCGVNATPAMGRGTPRFSGFSDPPAQNQPDE
jgi:hypothetical protein